MEARGGREPLRSPERLDTRFGVVAGLYVAALLAPGLVLVAVRRLQVASAALAVSLLCAVGAVLTAVVGREVIRRGGLASWFQSTWVALLVPAFGVVPMVVYLFDLVVFLAFLVTDLRPDTAASLVGFAGFALGVVAAVLGGVLVVMARTRVAVATVDNGSVEAEWTARWDLRGRATVALGTLAVVGSVFGAAVWQLGWSTASRFLHLGLIPVIVISSLMARRDYRATPAGLEHRRTGRLSGPRQITPWSRFDGFTVTDGAIVLHRPLPHLDVRCRRWDVDVSADANEEAVVAALETHLDRRDAGRGSGVLPSPGTE